MHEAKDVSRDMMHSARVCCTVCLETRVAPGEMRRLKLRDAYLKPASMDRTVQLQAAESSKKNIQVNCSVCAADGANAVMQAAGAKAGLAHKETSTGFEHQVGEGHDDVGEGYLEQDERVAGARRGGGVCAAGMTAMERCARGHRTLHIG
jgi:hypothetical protein